MSLDSAGKRASPYPYINSTAFCNLTNTKSPAIFFPRSEARPQYASIIDGNSAVAKFGNKFVNCKLGRAHTHTHKCARAHTHRRRIYPGVSRPLHLKSFRFALDSGIHTLACTRARARCFPLEITRRKGFAHDGGGGGGREREREIPKESGGGAFLSM